MFKHKLQKLWIKQNSWVWFKTMKKLLIIRIKYTGFIEFVIIRNSSILKLEKLAIIIQDGKETIKMDTQVFMGKDVWNMLVNSVLNQVIRVGGKTARKMESAFGAISTEWVMKVNILRENGMEPGSLFIQMENFTKENS